MSSIARAWAVRTLWSSSATSPKKAPGPELDQDGVDVGRQRDFHPAAQDEKEALAFLALVEDDFVGEITALVHEAVDHGEIAHGKVLEQDDVLEQLQARIAVMRKAKEHCRRA